MAKPTFDTVENNLRVVRHSEGLSNRLVPLSMEFEVINGNSLFNYIMDLSGFNKSVENKLNSKPDYVDFEGYTEEYKKKKEAELDKLKDVIRASKPKITIKIELEKYE